MAGGRANVASAVGASSSNRTNWYGRHQAPGVIQAPYIERAGHEIGSAIQQAGQAFVGINEAFAWEEAGMDITQYEIQNAKMSMEKARYENAALKLNFADTMQANKDQYTKMKAAGVQGLPDTFEKLYSNQIEFANSMVNQLLGVDKSPTVTAGTTHSPIASTEVTADIETPKNSTITTTSYSTNKENQDNTAEDNTKLSATAPQLTLTDIAGNVKSLESFKTNYGNQINSFMSEVTQLGNVDKIKNPVEWGVAMSVNQHKDEANWQPRLAYNEQGKAMAVFDYVDGIGDDAKNKSASIPLEAFGNKKFWKPLEAPENMSNFVVTNKTKMPLFNQEYFSAAPISDQAWKQFEAEFDNQISNQGSRFVQSMNRNLQIATKGAINEITDADGNGTINGADFRKLAEPFLTDGRITADAQSIIDAKRQGRAAAAKELAKKQALETSSTSTSESPEGVDEKVKEAKKTRSFAGLTNVGNLSNVKTFTRDKSDTDATQVFDYYQVIPKKGKNLEYNTFEGAMQRVEELVEYIAKPGNEPKKEGPGAASAYEQYSTLQTSILKP